MFKVGIIVLMLLSGLKHAGAQKAAAGVSANQLSAISLVHVASLKKTSINIAGKPLTLFVFLSPECPLSQNYTKVINTIADQYKQAIKVYGIVPGDAYTVKEATDFKDKYKLAFDLLIDPQQLLTNKLQATITPQAILVNAQEIMLYSGAIDNWVIALGKKRAHVTEHYVVNAIEQSLQNTVVAVQSTVAIGCRINDY